MQDNNGSQDPFNFTYLAAGLLTLLALPLMHVILLDRFPLTVVF
ncbi:hypothetical protein P4S73_08885 [Paraglaciecola sp. Hal342]